MGLSPRVWGSQAQNIIYGDLQRSIPTCVGQPACTLLDWPVDEVYPHVCGAARVYSMTSPQVWGLSPRVWGSLIGVIGVCHTHRSIPTCVGQPCF